jgi:hypothetical protein
VCRVDEQRERRKVPEEMSTTFATQLAPVAVDARPCTGLVHGYRWSSAAAIGMNLEFMNETTNKRFTRRLGKQPT